MLEELWGDRADLRTRFMRTIKPSIDARLPEPILPAAINPLYFAAAAPPEQPSTGGCDPGDG